MAGMDTMNFHVSRIITYTTNQSYYWFAELLLVMNCFVVVDRFNDYTSRYLDKFLFSPILPGLFGGLSGSFV